VIQVKRLLLTLAALVGVLSLTVGLSSGFAATGASGAKVAVATTSLGRILVDARGHTLYLFEKDKMGKSACSGQCATFWPPLITSGKPIAAAGVKASLLGTTKRADGRLQVTYNHHPLYGFYKDTARGQTKGQGLDFFGGEWYAVSPAGKTVEKEAKTASSSSSSPGYGYGSGYGS
jgi:predicted lipoprotein with Yx(FWY)xxD motif